MTTPAVATVIKMLESLPEPLQEQVADHLREYLADLQDHMQWDATFKATQPALIAAARRARQQLADGLAEPLDDDRL